MSSLQFVPIGESGFRCTVVSSERDTDRYLELLVNDVEKDSDPAITGSPEFISNQALVSSLLVFGVNEYARRNTREDEVRKAAGKVAEHHGNKVQQLAEYVNLGSYKTQRGWCSSCFSLTTHHLVDTASMPQVCLCGSCGESTTPCTAPGCRHLARRGHGAFQFVPYCAEHRHEIRSFERGTAKYKDLDSLDDLREYESANLSGITKTVITAGVGAAVVAPIAFLAAPAIGGALGASGLIGPALSGAAASSHGLAVLGGGTLAAGGLGMAGGTAVVAAAGATLGGTLGAVTTTAYLQDDRSFAIEKLQDGTGTPVILSSGFMTAKEVGWGEWKRLVDSRYATHPVYRLRWGAKELATLAAFAGTGLSKAGVGVTLKLFAAQATKKAANLIPGLSALAIIQSIITNPWHVALNRSEQTAAILADLLSRVEAPAFVLIGHSLGARVMLRTAELLASKEKSPDIEALHLIGAAVGVGGDWKLLSEATIEGTHNYHSTNDPVLQNLYTTAQLGKKAIGGVGFNTAFANIVDVDVSDRVSSHSGYFECVDLPGPTQQQI